MPSLKDTKRRILSVQSTQKITRAMKLVSSAKFSKANRAVMSATPFFEEFDRTLRAVTAYEGLAASSVYLHPFPSATRRLVILLTPDRGLCGGLNANLVRRFDQFLAANKELSCDVFAWGKRAAVHVAKRPVTVIADETRLLDQLKFEGAVRHASHIGSLYRSGMYLSVELIFPRFVNALVQEPACQQLLPITLQEPAPDPRPQLITEPSRREVESALFERSLAVEIYRALLSAQVSEHAARMTAMDNATQNADQVIRRLTLEYNRARQAAITKELIEITSGAEAL